MLKNKNLILLISVVIVGVLSSLFGGAVVLYFLSPKAHTSELYELVNSNNEKVIVEAEDDIEKSIIQASNATIGFYKKSSMVNKRININDYAFQGLALTNDGWVFSLSKIENYAEYIAISGDGQIYEIVKIIPGNFGTFVKLIAHDLSVLPIAKISDAHLAKELIFRNAIGEIFLTSIQGFEKVKEKSMDDFWQKIKFQNMPSSNFVGSVVMLRGGVFSGVLMVDSEFLAADRIMHELKTKLTASDNNLELKFKAKYVDLMDFVDSEKEGFQNGAMLLSLEEDGALFKAGLREADIILAINGNKLLGGVDLADALRTAKKDRIVLEYARDGVSKIVELKL